MSLVTFVFMAWAAIVAQTSRSVVPVQTIVNGEMRTVCSAVVVGVQRLVSEEHCFADDNPRWVSGIPVTVTKTEEEIVLLEAADHYAGWRPIEVRRDPLEPGENIAAVGYGMGFDHPMVTTGVVAIVNDHSVWSAVGKKVNVFAIESIRGQSGGAIVDSKGRLVSLVRAELIDNPDAVLIGITTQEFRKILRSFGLLDK